MKLMLVILGILFLSQSFSSNIKAREISLRNIIANNPLSDFLHRKKEDETDKLYKAIAPLEFYKISDNSEANLIYANEKTFLKLRSAIRPFHLYMLKISKNMIDKKTGQISATDFNAVDHGLFGYQAILRKLVAIEDAYSDTQNPNENIRLQIALARGVTTYIAATLHEEVFSNKDARRMFKDLIDTRPPRNYEYIRRNQELDFLFVRSLQYDFRVNVASELKALNVDEDHVYPFSYRTILRKLENKNSYYMYNFSDNLHYSVEAMTYNLSWFFGQIAGNIKFRRGHFDKRQDVNQYLSQRLKPFDILVEKSPFALTDNFIPGHYTHAALYLGTKEQLQALGLWDREALIPFQQSIEDGLVLIEALRPGTKLSRLIEFQNIDEIAVFRVKNILDDYDIMETVLTNALSQNGKPYDFNFDVATKTFIVCSELIYHSIPFIKWPTEFKVGRETITPDNLVELAFYSNSPIEFAFAIYAKNKGELQHYSLDDIAPLLGFKKNGDIFEKHFEICQNVTNSRIRVGGHREHYLTTRKCHDEFREQIYKESNPTSDLQKQQAKLSLPPPSQ